MKTEKIYSNEAVYNYLESLDDLVTVYQIPGSLADNFIIFHGEAVEVLQEKYINPWASGTIRHIYRKRIPASVYSIVNNAADTGIIPEAAAEEIRLQLENFRDRIACKAAAAEVAEAFK